MSLLDKASLIVTPNAYKSGTLYSVIPSDGSGDMTFSRASTGTRVNSQGLVEVVPYNLVQYSNTFSNAAWTKTNTTVTSGQSGYDGTTNAWKLQATATNNCEVDQSFTASETKTFSIYAKAGNVNFVAISVFGAGFGWYNLSNGTLGSSGGTFVSRDIESIGNGWYRCSIVTNVAASGVAVYVCNADNSIATSVGSNIFIQNSQLESGSVPTTYLNTESRLNIPRLDYSNGSCPSLLLEPQRTNIVLNSEDFSAATWINFQTSETVNDTTAPNGLNTADRMTQTGAGSGSIYNASVSLSGASTASCYFKVGTSDFVAIDSNGTGGYWGASFNLTTLAITYFGSGTNGKIEDVGNGWFRCSVSVNTTGVNYLAFGIIGNISDYVYIWGAQLEAGSYATSYIPTTSTSVTRVADSCSKTGISSLIGQTEGTLFFDVEFPQNQDASYIGISDGTTGNRIILGCESGTFYTFGYGYSVLSLNTNTRYRIAMAYDSTNMKIYANGSLLTTVSGAVPSGMSRFAFDSGANTQHCIADVYSSILFKTKLSDTELQNLTTI